MLLSMHEEPIFATRAFQAGALGYVTKASAPEVLVEAVRRVAQGQRYLSQDMAQALALQSVGGGAAGLDVLSNRCTNMAVGIDATMLIGSKPVECSAIWP